MTHLLGHGLLVVMRSTPEYLLAFILLQLWGPSMLPAVVALAIHNGGIIAHPNYGRWLFEFKVFGKMVDQAKFAQFFQRCTFLILVF